VVGRHATSLRASELSEHGANAYIVYFGRIEVGEFGDRGFENLCTR
jgi:hypothetical protein